MRGDMKRPTMVCRAKALRRTAGISRRELAIAPDAISRFWNLPARTVSLLSRHDKEGPASLTSLACKGTEGDGGKRAGPRSARSRAMKTKNSRIPT